jgi:hypothetical protein
MVSQELSEERWHVLQANTHDSYTGVEDDEGASDVELVPDPGDGEHPLQYP